jgi:hypothetical protein
VSDSLVFGLKLTLIVQLLLLPAAGKLPQASFSMSGVQLALFASCRVLPFFGVGRCWATSNAELTR